MRSSNWHILPGRGDQNLSQISHDVERYIRHGQDLELFREVAADLGNRAIGLSQQLVHNIASQEAIDNLVDDLALEELKIFARSHLAEVALKELIEISRGISIGGKGKRLVLAVKESGVSRRKVYGDEESGLVYKGDKPLEPGATLEGKIMHFSSSPAQGGRLEIENFLARSIVTGLVDPKTGGPRVGLDILAKG
jgi:hypothetical protein